VIRALVATGAVALVLLAGEVWAVSFTLSEAERQAAIRAGERSTTGEGFDREWRVSADGETATVLTPFHRLLIAARHAAFKNTSLKPAEVERTLKQDAGRLVVAVQLRGTREDFARHYAPRLLAGEREIKPAFVQNERTAMRQDDGRFVARCLYGFPVRDLTGRERVALRVADAEGRAVSRFTLDLSTMR
jgi:hypothetical protein